MMIAFAMAAWALGAFKESPLAPAVGRETLMAKPRSRAKARRIRHVLVAMLLLQLLSAATAAEWREDPGERIQGALPEIIQVGDLLRLYYFDGEIKVAESTDGLEFRPLGDLVLGPDAPPGADPSVVVLKSGVYRLYFKTFEGSGGPDEAEHRIHSAHSNDGLQFTYDGLVINTRSDGHHVSVPDALVLPDGRVRLYYVSAEHIQSHISTDETGTRFVEEPGIRLADHYDPSADWLGDEVLMLITGPSYGKLAPGNKTKLFLATSRDGFEFGSPILVHADDSTHLADASWVLMPNGTLRVYYWALKDNPPMIRSVATEWSHDSSPFSGTSSAPPKGVASGSLWTILLAALLGLGWSARSKTSKTRWCGAES